MKAFDEKEGAALRNAKPTPDTMLRWMREDATFGRTVMQIVRAYLPDVRDAGSKRRALHAGDPDWVARRIIAELDVVDGRITDAIRGLDGVLGCEPLHAWLLHLREREIEAERVGEGWSLTAIIAEDTSKRSEVVPAIRHDASNKGAA